ncbi:sensor histidine kinase [Smaragdicoccus niigatensis]|uniref:sensor histidine kinase n=1 Tax=Smaragdicoccus niigatensis TaxID=359359 RepID=UPI00037CA9EA|nr:HAMP domain-containing sensor histidine kinase [Smaragdicoccus niigatensis]
MLRRAARAAAWQAASILGLVVLIAGIAIYLVEVHLQNQQIANQLSVVAATADDAVDPPPGMALVMRGPGAKIQMSANAPTGAAALLSGSAGYTDLQAGDQHYRALVADNPDGRVVVLLDSSPYEADRRRLLLGLALAEVVGLAVSAAVAQLFSRRAIRPLNQALDLQRRFVADASHELRAPLTVLHTRAQLLARRADQLDPIELRRQVDGIVADTRALGDVVEDLLLSASLEAVPRSLEPIDLLELSREVRDSVTTHAESIGIHVDVEQGAATSASAYVVMGSRALRRALFALVDNALAHERPGGSVVLRLDRTDTDVSVAVEDTGVGIDPEVVDDLFTRFAHGENQPTGGRRYGIGLALVREIAQAHHGEVFVASTPGKGATFTLCFPAVEKRH